MDGNYECCNKQQPTLQKKRRYTKKNIPSFKEVFSSEEEAFLVKHVDRLLRNGYNLTPHALRTIAYHFAEELELPHQFDKKSKTAGYDWLYTFLEKNKEIKLFAETQNALSRHYPHELFQFKRSEFLDFKKKIESFTLLSQIYEQYEFYTKPENNFIFSEISCNLTHDKGVRKSCSIISCFSATGIFIPPVFIFQGVKVEKNVLSNLPQTAEIYLNNRTSKMNLQLFLQWLNESFIPRKPPGKCILIFEGCPIYLNNNEVRKIVDQNGIIILSFDIISWNFVKIFKKMYEFQLSTGIIKSNSDMLKSIYIIGNALSNMILPKDAISEFRQFGIFPLNRSLLPSHCYKLFDTVCYNTQQNSDYTFVDNADSEPELIYESINKIEEMENLTEKVHNIDQNCDNKIQQELDNSENDKPMTNDFSNLTIDSNFENVLTNQEYNTRKDKTSDLNEDCSQPFACNSNVMCNVKTQTLSLKFNLHGQCKSTQFNFNSDLVKLKKCFIPKCHNTSHSDIKKVFTKVQLNNVIYKKLTEKYGHETIPSAYVFCENHFDLPKDTANWIADNTPNREVNKQLQLKTVPIYDKNDPSQMKSSTIITKRGTVICLCPKLKYPTYRSILRKIRIVYEMKNKIVCDSQIQCNLQVTKQSQGTQIDVNDSAGQLIYCSVPTCPSTNADMPKKVFFSVPEDETIKAMLEQSLGISIDQWKMSYTPDIYCCEDHLNELNQDWHLYKIEGCKITVRRNNKSTSSEMAKKRKL